MQIALSGRHMAQVKPTPDGRYQVLFHRWASGTWIEMDPWPYDDDEPFHSQLEAVKYACSMNGRRISEWT